MAKKCCANCAYSIRPRTRWLRVALRTWPGLGICFNKAGSAGELAEICLGGICANYRASHSHWWRRWQVKQPADESVKYIPLTQGKVAIVDAEDYEELSQYKWYLQKKGWNSYAVRRENGKIIRMHRQIMNTPEGLVVDHKDGCGLHNRKCNMRNCTRTQNGWNSRPHVGGSTGLKGVDYVKSTGKYRAQIEHKGVKHDLGEYDSPVEAAVVRDRKAYEFQGEFAYLNFPDLVHRKKLRTVEGEPPGSGKRPEST